MAVKRRIIWMNDEEWSSLKDIAKSRGDSISGVIRDFWRRAAPPAKIESRRDTAFEAAREEFRKKTNDLSEEQQAARIQEIVKEVRSLPTGVQYGSAMFTPDRDAYSEFRPAPKSQKVKRASHRPGTDEGSEDRGVD